MYNNNNNNNIIIIIINIIIIIIIIIIAIIITTTTQRAQSIIQSNLYPIRKCLPLKSRTKHEAISATRVSVTINGVYNEIVHFRRNIFNIPSEKNRHIINLGRRT